MRYRCSLNDQIKCRSILKSVELILMLAFEHHLNLQKGAPGHVNKLLMSNFCSYRITWDVKILCASWQKKKKNLGSLVQPLYHSSDVHKNISEQKYQGTSLPLLGLFAGFCIEQKSVIFFDSAELMPKSKGKASVPGQQMKRNKCFYTSGRFWESIMHWG